MKIEKLIATPLKSLFKSLLEPLMASLLVFLLVFIPAQQVSAQNTLITLDKGAQQFVKVENDLELLNMQPGEERTAKIQIVNSSGEQMQFYINGAVIDNIADKGDQKAFYELDLQREGEADPYYQGTIGASEATANTALAELSTDTLLATLEDGESTTLLIKVTLDGESMGNEYMGQIGSIQLNISASDIDTVQEVSFFQVKTNDTAHVVLYIVICIVALAVCITGGVVFRKKKDIEK